MHVMAEDHDVVLRKTHKLDGLPLSDVIDFISIS